MILFYFQSVFAAQMGILEVGLKKRKRAVSTVDKQSIDQMKEIIAAQNKKKTLVYFCWFSHSISHFVLFVGYFRYILSSIGQLCSLKSGS